MTCPRAYNIPSRGGPKTFVPQSPCGYQAGRYTSTQRNKTIHRLQGNDNFFKKTKINARIYLQKVLRLKPQYATVQRTGGYHNTKES